MSSWMTPLSVYCYRVNLIIFDDLHCVIIVDVMTRPNDHHCLHKHNECILCIYLSLPSLSPLYYLLKIYQCHVNVCYKHSLVDVYAMTIRAHRLARSNRSITNEHLREQYSVWTVLDWRLDRPHQQRDISAKYRLTFNNSQLKVLALYKH